MLTGKMMSEIVRRLLLACVILAGLASTCRAESSDILMGVPLDYHGSVELSKAYVQGQRDFVAYMNLQGGVEGHQIRMLDGEHSNKIELGIEEYERMRAAGVLTVDPMSTIVARTLTQRALNDKVNLLTFYTGRSDTSDGKVFPYVFPLSPTYWSQAALLIHYFAEREGGSLKGKTIGYVSDSSPSALGMSTLPFVQELSRRLGFKLVTALYPRAGDRTPALAEFVKSKPDWTLVWDGGPNKQIVYKYLYTHGIKPARVGTLVWLAEPEMKSISQLSKGMLKFEGVATGTETPLIRKIVEQVVAPGAGSGPEENVGTTPYNIGVASAATVAQAAKLALASSAHDLTREGLHNGFEHISNFDAGGLEPPMTITSSDHQGGGAGRIVRWTGARWKPVTGWQAAYQDLVWEFIHRSSSEFVQSTGR